MNIIIYIILILFPTDGKGSNDGNAGSGDRYHHEYAEGVSAFANAKLASISDYANVVSGQSCSTMQFKVARVHE